jgi:hypothetical protein
MFSVAQKRAIAEALQGILRATGHPELPPGEISFKLHVDGAESWSWADIQNNGAVPVPTVNPHNEAMAAQNPLDKADELIAKGTELIDDVIEKIDGTIKRLGGLDAGLQGLLTKWRTEAGDGTESYYRALRVCADELEKVLLRT